MTSGRRLRLRFLAVLSGGMALGAVPLACSSSDSRAEDLKPSCSTGSAMTACFAPGSTHFNTGNIPNPPAPPTPNFDANNCQVREEVRDGCCNAAASGPELIEGECCYGFCTGACCGRPLLVDGDARIAPVANRSDWLDSIEVELGGLTPDERVELSRAWLRDAQLEHASVASFARFMLDLLAFGAPADLVERAQRAMADEIRHARMCFGLASAYAGTPLGPAALDLRGVAPSPSLAAAAVAAVHEGCINETIAALAATEQAERATDASVRQVLTSIARDEAEHAELAWRFVHWAWSSGGVAVSSAIQAALSGQVSVPPLDPASSGQHQHGLREHGRLAPAELSAVARAAWREVIAPCAAALG